MPIVKADKDSEAGVAPSEELLTEMGKDNEGARGKPARRWPRCRSRKTLGQPPEPDVPRNSGAWLRPTTLYDYLMTRRIEREPRRCRYLRSSTILSCATTGCSDGYQS